MLFTRPKRLHNEATLYFLQGLEPVFPSSQHLSKNRTPILSNKGLAFGLALQTMSGTSSQEAFCFHRAYDGLLFFGAKEGKTSKLKPNSYDANGFVESKTEAKVCVPELGTYSCLKLVYDSPTV